MLTKQGIQLAVLKNDPKIKFVKNTKRKSVVWCLFARVYYDNVPTAFVSCFKCKHIIRHHPKHGTGELVKHKCSEIVKCEPFEAKDMPEYVPENLQFLDDYQSLENSEDDDDGRNGDDTDSNKSVKATKTKLTTKKSARKSKPKVEKEWSDDSIYTLIELVKDRRALWDKGSDEYKLPTKESFWQEIADAFGENCSIPECKAKWANLRISFNNNLSKERNRKAMDRLGCNDDKFKIIWRFYKHMMFLEATTDEVHQSTTQSTTQSPMNLLHAETVHSPSALTELQFETHKKPAVKITPLRAVKRKRLKLSLPQSPSTVSPSPLPIFKAVAVQEGRGSRESKTKFEAFGEYIAKELENLPKSDAEFVQRKLNRVLLDLLDEVALKNASQHTQQQLASDNDTFDGFDAESFVKKEFIEDTP